MCINVYVTNVVLKRNIKLGNVVLRIRKCKIIARIFIVFFLFVVEEINLFIRKEII